MLLRFRFSNFRSFRAEQELSLIAGPFKDQADVVLYPAGIREGVLPVAAIYGANASGKTNVIRAFEFMASAVGSSHRIWEPDGPIPRDPFLADEDSRREVSTFEVDFLLRGVRHQYGFRIDSAVVLEEWLFVYPRGKKQTWFHRTRGIPISFSTKMPGENRTIENLTRKNSLYLSAAAQNNHGALMPIFRWLTSHLFVIGGRSAYRKHTSRLCAHPYYCGEVARLVSGADLGISDIKVKEDKSSVEVKETIKGTYNIIKMKFEEIVDKTNDYEPEIHLLHKFSENSVPFEMDKESEGTIAYFSLLGPSVTALKNGTTLFIDEIDASLHPLLAIQLIQTFNSRSSNPKDAQLIFNTHDTNLLTSSILRRDQIWFTEKNKDGSSQLYPLSDFKPRKQENLQTGYLQGRYGAIPFINPDAFLLSFEGKNGEA